MAEEETFLFNIIRAAGKFMSSVGGGQLAQLLPPPLLVFLFPPGVGVVVSDYYMIVQGCSTI